TESAKQALETTNIKLERSNKELQDFTYIASHDLREPLRKISAFGQLLQESLEGKLDEDEEENFAFMIDGATRMQQKVNDLLLYSRETTKAKPSERVDLNAVIENLKDVELAVQVEETGGVINVPEPLPLVDADPSLMHQLLQNLIGNGLKYSRKGVAPVITVRSRQEAEKRFVLRFRITALGLKWNIMQISLGCSSGSIPVTIMRARGLDWRYVRRSWNDMAAMVRGRGDELRINGEREGVNYELRIICD
ncbi:Bacteriophytochrome (light-regulated signal transduction histidine kinase), partial [Methanophagales archaeon]